MASATTDVAFPALLGPAEIDWSLERNVVTLTSPLSRSVQDVARGGDRWKATVKFPAFDGDDAAAIACWLDQISKPGWRGLLPVFQNDMSGTESGGSAFGNVSADPSTWTAYNGPVIVKAIDGGTLLWAQTLPGGTTNARVAQLSSIVGGYWYLASVDVPPMQAFQWRWAGNANAGGIAFSTSLSSSAGRQQQAVYGGSSATQYALNLFAGDGATSFQWTRWGRVTFSRIFTARDAVSAGASSLTLQGGDSAYALTSPALKRGQFFNVLTSWGWELKRALSSPLMLNSINVNGVPVTHAGDLRFEPPLRGSVAANAPIRHIEPYARMMLPQRLSSANISAPLHHAFSFELVEDIT